MLITFLSTKVVGLWTEALITFLIDTARPRPSKSIA